MRKNTPSEKIQDNTYAYDISLNLKDAGCKAETIKEFMQLKAAGDTKRQMKLLTEHRLTLIENLHRDEKQIDCLDYLIYRLQTEVD